MQHNFAWLHMTTYNKDFVMICWFFSGGRLISLNKTSLEGVTFSDAAAILQSSPDEVELIVSQPKRKTGSLFLNYIRLS